jgi:GNAT superfamily N-acetyltransferase
MRLDLATPQDGPGLLALRVSATAWLLGRGIRQWRPGDISAEDVLRQVDAGEWYVVGHGNSLRGGLRLLWSDEPVWGPNTEDAAYVHGLVIDRRFSGTGLGSGMLAWAEEQALLARRARLRLDCVETNDVLRRYYVDRGYREVGRKQFDDGVTVVLMEKALPPGDA